MNPSKNATFDLVPDSRNPYQRLAREVIQRAVQDVLHRRDSTPAWAASDAADFLLRRTDSVVQFWFRLADIDLDWFRGPTGPLASAQDRLQALLPRDTVLEEEMNSCWDACLEPARSA